jgi:hypothetical protein
MTIHPSHSGINRLFAYPYSHLECERGAMSTDLRFKHPFVCVLIAGLRDRVNRHSV